MTEDPQSNRHNQEVEFEREDLAPKPIFIFLISLTVGCVLVSFVLRGLYRYLDAYENRHQPVQSPLAPPARTDTRIVEPGDITTFPQPRLESNERLEIREFRLKEEEQLNSYGWVEEKAGIVHIPIERAMELLAQRGLPTRPQAGAVPPSVVSMAKEAARKSDTSRAPAKKE
jgi:hypothetical protein